MKDGSYVNMTAYNIEGNNYFKLRDLGVQFGFEVGWNSDANAVTIDTDGVVDEIKKEEQKQEVASDGVRWDLISTEWCDMELESGEKYGMPEYMMIGRQSNKDGEIIYSAAYDLRTGDEHFILNGDIKADNDNIPKIIKK